MNIEPLESRIAPAVVIAHPLTATYTDVDGDLVTIKTTAGVLNNSVFTSQMLGLGEQLLLIDLTGGGFAGTDLTVTVKKARTGDGIANIGAINAAGFDLGKVTLPGDLGQIDAGDATTSTTALELLKVRSIGLFGVATQRAGGSLESSIEGPLGALVVAGDVHGATVAVIANNKADGRIGSVFIGGSLIGSTVVGPVRGEIISSGDMGPVRIGGNLIGGVENGGNITAAFGRLASVTIGGSVMGGSGANSATIFGGASLGPVRIGGDFIGGAGIGSAKISTAMGNIQSVTIGGSVLGAGMSSAGISSAGALGPVIIGGNLFGLDTRSAWIEAETDIASVTIGGSLVGGTGENSGLILARNNIGAVKIGRDLKAGTGDFSGRIDANVRLESLRIGGSILGNEASQNLDAVTGLDHDGQVFAGLSIGTVSVGGDVVGGSGTFSGAIHVGFSNNAIYSIDRVTIGGSLRGGAGRNSGSLLSAGQMGPVSIGGSIYGGGNTSSGTVSANGGDLGNVTIGGSLVGGTGGPLAGALFSRGNMGAVSIGGDLLGGTSDRAGYISSFGTLARVTIGGSLVGGTGAASGGISANGAIGVVSIAHDFLGGSIPGQSGSLFSAGSITSLDRIGSVFVGGSIISGTDASAGGDLSRNASIRAGADIGSLTVRGGIIGSISAGGDSPVIISAVGRATPGATTDFAFGSITVGGRVEWARFLAGYDLVLAPVNADAQIGPVKVGADWIASSLVAGATNPGNDGLAGGTGLAADNVHFGNFLDAKMTVGDTPGILSRIASVTIGGQVFGSPQAIRGGDSFGFVAQEIGALKIAGQSFTLQPGQQNDGFPIARRLDGIGSDTTLHEITPAIGSTLSVGIPSVRVNASTVTYTDSDGDRVTLKFSKPLLTDANVNNVVHFDFGMVGDGGAALRQLQYLDLRPLASNGLGVTVTVVRGTTGDGLAHVGGIVSTGFDVGAVKIPGDLGVILAGDANLKTAGAKSLHVRTLGRLALDTQGLGLPALAPTLRSAIEGPLGTLIVAQDVVGATLNVNGKVGALTIGGSLIGGDGVESGTIFGIGLGAVKIGHHVQGGLGADSGKVQNLASTVTSLTVGGSILGGGGALSGEVHGGGGLGPVKIGHNLRGGTGESSGQIENGNKSITIGGSVLGGSGVSSGQLVTEGRVVAVKIGHNLAGGTGAESGGIFNLGLKSATIGGSLIGGTETLSGSIRTIPGGDPFPGDIGTVKIGGDIFGSSGADSAKISASGMLGSLTVGGSVFGGSASYDTVPLPGGGFELGQIFTLGKMGKVTLGGNLIGGAGTHSAHLRSEGSLASISIGGSLVGAAGESSGRVRAEQTIGSVKIGREIFGGSQDSAGFILSDDAAIKMATLGGSIFGGTGTSSGGLEAVSFGSVKIVGDVLGGGAFGAGYVQASGGKLGSLSIGGSLIGGTAGTTGLVGGTELGSVQIGRNIVGSSIAGNAAALDSTGLIISGDRLGGVTVNGSIFAGFDASTGGSLTRNGSIRAADDIGALAVRGSLHGTSTANGANPVIFSARGSETPTATKDVAINSIKIGGGVERALLLAGYDPAVDAANTLLSFANNKAQIGAVTVGRDWLASSLVAGIVNGAVNFGDGNDALALLGGGALPRVAKIASIVIQGAVAGTASPTGDHFGFTSVTIGKFKSLGFTAPLTSGAIREVFELSPITGDVTIREV